MTSTKILFRFITFYKILSSTCLKGSTRYSFSVLKSKVQFPRLTSTFSNLKSFPPWKTSSTRLKNIAGCLHSIPSYKISQFFNIKQLFSFNNWNKEVILNTHWSMTNDCKFLKSNLTDWHKHVQPSIHVKIGERNLEKVVHTQMV